jgi:hypothetical protein
MKSLRSWSLAAATMLAACGDGGIQSPDFTSVVTVESLAVQPANPQQGSSLPAGTTLSLRAIATLSRTAPPGTPGAVDGVIRTQEDVSGLAGWQSADASVATVEGGLVTGVQASSAPVAVIARYEGLSAQFDVTVTDAVLTGVDHVRPQGAAFRADNRYTVAANADVPFEIYGDFTDGEVRLLDESSFDVTWASDSAAVADNPGDDNRFETLGVGSAQITGTVTNVPGANPASATATLVVEPANAFCETEFVAPPALFSTAASTACVGCTVDQAAAIFDADIETFGTMSIPLGLLLQADVSVTASQTPTNPLRVGRAAGFLVSRSGSLLSAELLSEVVIETVNCDEAGENCTVQESFGGDPALSPLYLALLGVIGDEPVSLLSTPPLTEASANANGLRLRFSGGLLSAAAALNVHSSCAVALETAEDEPGVPAP